METNKFVEIWNFEDSFLLVFEIRVSISMLENGQHHLKR